MIHHVFANRANIGDWLSAKGIQSLLRPQAVTEHLCDEPFIAQTLEELSRATTEDLIIIGGGGLFMDYFTPFWEGFRVTAARVPFSIWGVGYCDLKREPSRAPRHILEEIIGLSRLCIVRDELTLRHLPRHALPPPVPCPSTCAVQRPQQAGWGLLHVDSYDAVGAEAYDAMDLYGREFATRALRPYRQTNNRISPGNEGGLASTLQLYADADIVLSSRLHGCILAVAMGRQVLAVSGDRKIEAFMQAAGLGDWVLDLDEVDALPDLLSALPRQRWPRDFVDWAVVENKAIVQRVQAVMEND